MARVSFAQGRTSRFDAPSLRLSPTTADVANTTTADLQTNPATAALADGGYVVAWVSFDTFGPRFIRTQRYTADGVEAGGETLASTRVPGVGETPVVAGLADGGYVVAYPYRLGTTANMTSMVLLQRFDAAGERVGAEVTVSSFTFDYMDRTYAFVGTPTLAPLDDGGWVIGWLHEFHDPVASPPLVETTFVQRYDGSGAPVGEATPYSGDTPVQPLSGGGYLIGSHIFDGSGTAAGHLAPDLTGAVAVATDALAGGGFVVVTLSAAHVLSAQLLDAAGDPLGTPMPLATGSMESLPEVVALPDGGYVVLWQWRADPQAALQLVAQRFDAAGDSVGDQLALAPPETYASAWNQKAPSAVVLADGSIALSWVASGTQGPDVVTLVLEEALAGGPGRDHLQGTGGADVIHGLGGRDRLQGLAGDDKLDGGAGADAMAGGPGNDRYMIDDPRDRISERADEGDDIAFASVDYVLPRHVESLVLHGAAVAGTGNDLDNLIIGSALANRLDGRDGSDTIAGGDGADVIVFSTRPGPGNVDTLDGFSAGEDTIELSARIFRALDRGPLAAGAFQASAQATEADDRILYDAATGTLAYDPDGSGHDPATVFAVLIGLTGAIGADTFVVQ
ncbi:MAG TPA: calcium-binding protein [Ramlibacter sp.]